MSSSIPWLAFWLLTIDMMEYIFIETFSLIYWGLASVYYGFYILKSQTDWRSQAVNSICGISKVVSFGETNCTAEAYDGPKIMTQWIHRASRHYETQWSSPISLLQCSATTQDYHKDTAIQPHTTIAAGPQRTMAIRGWCKLLLCNVSNAVVLGHNKQ